MKRPQYTLKNTKHNSTRREEDYKETKIRDEEMQERLKKRLKKRLQKLEETKETGRD